MCLYGVCLNIPCSLHIIFILVSTLIYSTNEKQELIFQKGINWNDYKTKYKRGSIIKKHSFEVDGPNGEIAIRSKWIPVETPIFTEDKDFLYNLIPKA